MKKLMIILILVFSSNVTFAQSADRFTKEGKGAVAPVTATPSAKRFIMAGETIDGLTLDATGYMHGIEMNTPGTAWLTNSKIENAGTDFVTDDGRHGDGRGIFVTGAGARLYVINTESSNNSEDGFRVNNGGELIISGSTANNNKKNGFFVGTGGTMELTTSSASLNLYGLMGANGFLDMIITYSAFFNNANQGMQLIEGGNVSIDGTNVYDNNTAKQTSPSYGGIGIFGVKNVTITNTDITGNYHKGLISVSDTSYDDAPVVVYASAVKILNNGGATAISIGDSHLSIVNSTLDGQCMEIADTNDPTSIGIITVDGKDVSSGPCP